MSLIFSIYLSSMRRNVLCAVLLTLLAACGGGGSGTSSPSDTTLKGTIANWPTGAMLYVNIGGEPLPVDVAADGSFSYSTSATGAYKLEISGVNTQEHVCTLPINAHGDLGQLSDIAIHCSNIADASSLTVSVSGLNENAILKLRNNGMAPVTVTGTSGDSVSYAFEPKLAHGATYQLEIEEPQPAGHKCDFAPQNSASGTVQFSDDTVVSIDCTLERYAVNVTVTAPEGMPDFVLKDSNSDLRIADLNDGSNIQASFQLEYGQLFNFQLENTLAGYDCTLQGNNDTAHKDVTIKVDCVVDDTQRYELRVSVNGLVQNGTIVVEDTNLLAGTQQQWTLGNGADQKLIDYPVTHDYTLTVTESIGHSCSPDSEALDGTVSGSGNVDETSTVIITCSPSAYDLTVSLVGFNSAADATLTIGVTLNEQAQDDLSFTADGSQTLSVLYKNSYALDLSELSGQQCSSEANLQGVMGSEPQAISLNCTLNSYTVSGTVTGLAQGNTLQLTNNGKTVAIDGNGFAFTVEHGSGYSLEAASGSPRQSCTFADGSAPSSGESITEDISGIAITCVDLYGLSGTLSGLDAGEELTITETNAGTLMLSENGSFSFESYFAKEGTLYSLTVTEQPDDQRCTIENASGAFGSGDVSVTIQCKEYVGPVISVSVSGLGADVSTPLVLQNNDGDDLSILANGDHSFATALAVGTAFSVTIKTQPTDYVCSILTGTESGNAAENMDPIDVTCVAEIAHYCAAKTTPDLSSTEGTGRLHDMLSPLGVAQGTTLQCQHFTEAGAGDKNGKDWANAFDANSLKTQLDGITDASSTQVYALLLAAGTYKPDAADRTKPFKLQSYVAIVGGFEAVGSYAHSLDNVSLLSGDIGTPDDNDDATDTDLKDNSYHVVSASGTDQTATLYGVSVSHGYADSNSDDHNNGGGLYVANNASVTITASTFTQNDASNEGGGIYSGKNSTVTMSRSAITYNRAAVSGGGLYANSNSVLEISGSNIAHNHSSSSGAGLHIAGYNTRGTIIGSTISHNQASRSGGGILISSSLVLIASTIAHNSAMNTSYQEGGGGIYCFECNFVRIINSSFTSNAATNGAAFYVGDTPAWSVINSTISGNSSENAIYALESSTGLQYFAILQSTLWNTPIYWEVANATLEISNSILWGNNTIKANKDYNTTNIRLRHTVLQGGKASIVATDTADGAYEVVIDSAKLLTTDPKLDTTNGLRDNGGAVETIALVDSSSSAINQGLYLYHNENFSTWYYCSDAEGTTCTDDAANVGEDSISNSGALPDEGYTELTATDARGYARSGKPDLGAYEYGASAPTTP